MVSADFDRRLGVGLVSAAGQPIGEQAHPRGMDVLGGTGERRASVQVDAHPALPTSHAVRSALNRIAHELARAGCRVGHRASGLPDLAPIARTWGQLLAAFTSADMPDDEYARLQGAAARLTGGDDAASIGLRASVATHRDWIQLDRLRTRIAHQWRQFFGAWDVLLCPVLPILAFPHEQREMEQRRIVIDASKCPTCTRRCGRASRR
jgi:amidase